MARSSQPEKARRLNAAYALLAAGWETAEVVDRLSERFAMSRRQAYRYAEQARAMEAPMELSEASVPITLKIPRSVVSALRAHAENSGFSMGEIVSRALAAFFRGSGGHG